MYLAVVTRESERPSSWLTRLRQSLGYALAAYSELLHHGLIDMMALNDDFIQKVIRTCNRSPS